MAESAADTDRTDVLGRRVAAGLLDLLVLFALMVVVGIIFGETETGSGSVSVSLEGVSALVWALAALGYYLLAEAGSGQTLGKLALGLQVEGEDGGKPGFGQIATRTLLRIVDFLPVFYLLGLLVAATGDRQQRLGDRAAHTRVVRKP